MKTFPFVYITQPHKNGLEYPFMNTTPFCKQPPNTGTPPSRPISPTNDKLEQVQILPLFVLGNMHHFYRGIWKIFAVEGEMLQHKAQPWAPAANRGLL